MSQTYNATKPESGVTSLGELYQIIRDHIAACVSMFSGTSYPASPVAGQGSFRTDLGSLGQGLPKLYFADGWHDIDYNSTIYNEVVAARGSAASIDVRLDVGINEDGTFKGSAPASSWWTTESQTPTYVSTTQFTVPTDLTAIYTVGRAVYFTGVAGAPQYSRVVSSSYGAPNTTVNITDAVLDVSLSGVFYGQMKYNVGLYDSATVTKSGIVELATQAEFLTMTDATRYVTSDLVADVLQYQEIYIDSGAMVALTTNGAESGTYEFPTNDHMIDYFAFDGATEEFISFKFRFPSVWDRSTIKVKFFWAPGDAACTAGDTVEWEIGGVAISDDDPIDATLGTAQVITDIVLAGKDGDLHLTSATPAITIGGTPALGDLVLFKASRNVSGTDDMTEDAWLFGITIQFKINQAVAAW
uniref:Putative tail protein n=1 Tax=viral metagenome TaxID=1070528 RepID=A0A6M3IJA1_9ZZZZ